MRYNLRTLCLAVALILTIVWGTKYFTTIEELTPEEALQVIEEFGGIMDSAVDSSSKENVYFILITNPKFGDSDISIIPKNIRIRSLSLVGTNVTDVGISEIAKSKHVEVLSLDCTRITKGSLNALSCMRGLKELNIRETGVLENDLPPLRASKTLEIVRLSVDSSDLTIRLK